jgi:subtilisin family serine protease
MYEKENLNFMNPHGTRIADLLAEKLRGVDYCLIFIQMFRNVEPMYPIPDDYVEALTRVREAGATAVNISLKSFEFVSQDQKNAFAETTKKIPIFLAAGNEYRDLSKKCDIYPVCYPFKHLIVVGAQDFENPKKHASYSNYGARVNLWAPGHFIDSDQEPLFGTSYATPRALAEYILFLESKSKKSCDAKTHKCVGH